MCNFPIPEKPSYIYKDTNNGITKSYIHERNKY